MTAPVLPLAKVAVADQRDVLFDLTHGWAVTGANPNVQQVAPLSGAIITIDERQMDALRAGIRRGGISSEAWGNGSDARLLQRERPLRGIRPACPDCRGVDCSRRR